MIVGKLTDLYRYTGISKNIDTAINYIKTHDLLALPKGKTIVDGDNVYINRDTYVAKPMEECFFRLIKNYTIEKDRLVRERNKKTLELLIKKAERILKKGDQQ